MHKIIGEALCQWDVQAAAAACTQTAHAASPLCFQHTTPGDLLLGEAKVVGSAQRRQRGALLQHGAIVLATSSAAPAIAGVKELTGRNVGIHELIDAVTRALTQDTRWDLVGSAWEATEQARVESLIATKYSQDAWNRKR
jgi:lipoate-protein ligase A